MKKYYRVKGVDMVHEKGCKRLFLPEFRGVKRPIEVETDVSDPGTIYCNICCKDKIPPLWDNDDVEYVNAIRSIFGRDQVNHRLPPVDSRIKMFRLPKNHPAYSGSNSFGICAKKRIPKDTIIGYYAGLYIPERSAPHNAYIMATDEENGMMYDAFACGNEMRFINGHLNIANKPNVYMADVVPIDNSDWVTARPIVTLRDIKPNEELLLDYGENYWDNLPDNHGKILELLEDIMEKLPKNKEKINVYIGFDDEKDIKKRDRIVYEDIDISGIKKSKI